MRWGRKLPANSNRLTSSRHCLPDRPASSVGRGTSGELMSQSSQHLASIGNIPLWFAVLLSAIGAWFDPAVNQRRQRIMNSAAKGILGGKLPQLRIHNISRPQSLSKMRFPADVGGEVTQLMAIQTLSMTRCSCSLFDRLLSTSQWAVASTETSSSATTE